jgi:hypothetical protein
MRKVMVVLLLAVVAIIENYDRIEGSLSTIIYK